MVNIDANSLTIEEVEKLLSEKLRAVTKHLLENINKPQPQSQLEYPEFKLESDNIDEILINLPKAQAEMQSVNKDNVNNAWRSKYATYDDIVECIRPILAKHGLSIVHQLDIKMGKYYLITKLCHAPNQFIASVMQLRPEKETIQQYGSYMTYVKRYCLGSLVGVSTAEDDDGEADRKQYEENNKQQTFANKPKTYPK